ncbi:hypothetical protein PV10_07191 [Exophiala mesophila]|uniref:Vacuolar protein sorting-associated protein 62 n=1 Tax=Exophiala mesophila TaxID=212818 RepID=A0A0D1WLF0_EXOME|nr:uncharacterized protein PV10_07191 [Exophiala mesophila]KIV89820.1 hypothetical protein PV10_07191 [Exophiala mesophila]
MLSLYYCTVILLLVTHSLSLPIGRRIQQRDVPDFVRRYAPVAYLSATEKYFPSDLTTHLANSHPVTGSGDPIPFTSPLSLTNLNTLSDQTDIYTTSNTGILSLPPWFHGTKPSPDGTLGTTRASVIITVSKPNNILDVFYFYFYTYNQGNWVLDNPALEFGNHVGDWEHTMIRFQNSLPQSVYYSQHSTGQAFSYSAVEKAPDGLRPVVYVARGSHANYAVPGPHDHTIPGFNSPVGPLKDHTDRGVYWDPSVGAYVYEYDVATGKFRAYDQNDPVEFLGFEGRWGDRQLGDKEKGQINVFGARKYTGGPTGPRDKKLAREAVCPDSKGCWVRPVLMPREVDGDEGGDVR